MVCHYQAESSWVFWPDEQPIINWSGFIRIPEMKSSPTNRPATCAEKAKTARQLNLTAEIDKMAIKHHYIINFHKGFMWCQVYKIRPISVLYNHASLVPAKHWISSKPTIWEWTEVLVLIPIHFNPTIVISHTLCETTAMPRTLKGSIFVGMANNNIISFSHNTVS